MLILKILLVVTVIIGNLNLHHYIPLEEYCSGFVKFINPLITIIFSNKKYLWIETLNNVSNFLNVFQ